MRYGILVFITVASMIASFFVLQWLHSITEGIENVSLQRRRSLFIPVSYLALGAAAWMLLWYIYETLRKR